MLAEITPPEHVTVKQVANYFDVHELTVRRWIADGKLPAIRVGKRAIRIRVADVNAFIRDRQLTAV